MTSEEAEHVIALVVSSWEWTKLNDNPTTVAMWRESLTRFDYLCACRAVTKLANTVERVPALATVIAATRAETPPVEFVAIGDGTDYPPMTEQAGRWAKIRSEVF